MRVGFLQYQVVFGNPEANQKKVTALIGVEKFDLLVLPELCFSGYFMPSREMTIELSEEMGEGKSYQFIRDLAREHNGAVVYGFPERAGGKVFNSAAMVLPDGTGHLYRKTHLYDLEKGWFDPGDTGFNVFEFRGAKIGMMICFDWLFPESARSLMLKGADIICHPSNLVMKYCQDAMVTRCLENRVFAITCNRTGVDKQGSEEIGFTGTSQITGKLGEILARAGRSDEIATFVDIEPSAARDKSVNSHNEIFSDRRTELYNLD